MSHPFAHIDPDRLIQTDQIRKSLPEFCAWVNDCGLVLKVGSGSRPIYELGCLSNLTEAEQANLVRVSADRARKSLPDIRSLTRINGIGFLITVGGLGLAYFRRAPEYDPIWPRRWIAEHEALSRASEGRSSQRIVSADRVASASEDSWISEYRSQPEQALLKLFRKVDALRQKVEKDSVDEQK